MGLSSSSAPLKVVQVGMGGFGRNWYESKIAPYAEVKVVGFVDVVPESLELLRERHGIAAELCYSDVDKAIEATAPDALIVTASLPGHLPSAYAGIRAGKHVLMEKPFAPSVAEAREITAAAEKAGTILMISQNYRYFPAPIRAQEHVLSGDLGDLAVIHVDFRRDHTSYNARLKLHYDLVHPLLADMSIHHFDLMRMVTGRDAKRVRATAWNPPWSHYKDPPAAELVVEMEGGLLITYRGSWISPGPVTAWAGEWRMEFEKGEVSWTSRADDTVRGDVMRVRPVPSEEADDPAMSEYTERLPAMETVDRSGSLAEFVHCVRTGETPQTTARANIGSIGLTYAAIASLESGDWEDVES